MNADGNLQNQPLQEDLKKLLGAYDLGMEHLVGINVVIAEAQQKPRVFLRMNTYNDDLIKLLISSAYHRRPVIILPQFPDSLQSINLALQKGIICRHNGGYRFTF